MYVYYYTNILHSPTRDYSTLTQVLQDDINGHCLLVLARLIAPDIAQGSAQILQPVSPQMQGDTARKTPQILWRSWVGTRSAPVRHPRNWMDPLCSTPGAKYLIRSGQALQLDSVCEKESR